MDNGKVLSIVISRIYTSQPYFIKVVQSLLADIRHPPTIAGNALSSGVSMQARWTQYRDTATADDGDDLDWDQQVFALPGTTLSDYLVQQGGSKRKRSITHFHGIPISILPPPTLYRHRPRESAPSPESMPSSPIEPVSPLATPDGSPVPKRPQTAPDFGSERVLRRSKRVAKLEGLLRKLDVAKVPGTIRQGDACLDTDMESDSDDEDDVTILV